MNTWATRLLYRTAVIRDKDGSLGAGPNAYVLIHDGLNNSIATDETACEIKPSWNAAVCKGDVGRLNVGGAGGGARGGGQGAGGGRAGGPAAAPAQPIVLSRNGKDYTMTGTNVRAGTEIKVKTEQPTVSLRLSELDKGSWVIFELPGFSRAAAGTAQTSLDALRKAGETSHFKDKDALWVEVVSPDSGPPPGPGRWNHLAGQPLSRLLPPEHKPPTRGRGLSYVCISCGWRNIQIPSGM